MDRSFEKYRGGPTKPAQDRLHVTINNQKVITLNKSVHKLMGHPEAVCLFFSRDQDMIAIQPSSTRLPESFPVQEKSSSGWRVNAAPFCRHFGIDIDTTLKFIDPDIRDGALHLKLSETVSVAQVRRKRRKKESSVA
jgi:hypothetical protein